MKSKSFTLKIDDKVTNFTLHPKQIIDGLEQPYVHGFILSNDNYLCLVRDYNEDKFTLIGGGIEKGETSKEALIREVHEEAQLSLKDIHLLGSLEILSLDKDKSVIEHHQQIRYFARISKIEQFVPRKDGWETEERIFVFYKDISLYIDWMQYESGQVQYKDTLKYITKK